MASAVTTDLRLIYHAAPPPVPDTKIKIGLTRGLVDSGEIFAQFSLSSTAQYQHLLSYISAICTREQILAIYWYSRADREFVLIHDNASLDQCLSHAGLHEILYIITNKGYKHKSAPQAASLQMKTSSPSSGPSPDTNNNLEASSEGETETGAGEEKWGGEVRKSGKGRGPGSMEWSYEVDQEFSVQEVSSVSCRG